MRFSGRVLSLRVWVGGVVVAGVVLVAMTVMPGLAWQGSWRPRRTILLVLVVGVVGYEQVW